MNSHSSDMGFEDAPSVMWPNRTTGSLTLCRTLSWPVWVDHFGDQATNESMIINM
ncbi:hypothetical protein [Xanthomonas fragariae]|uniref:hypothetical protein n=1 Tax=Xanthomonas fragariae TaxID=48664 RepID=UPI0022AADD46|nr:hypothetical protein [Xanthomonas fragariae]WAT15887.1 hypothetical protein OZ429_05930 [Xanthomonas fragariae]